MQGTSTLFCPNVVEIALKTRIIKIVARLAASVLAQGCLTEIQLCEEAPSGEQRECE